MKPPFPVPDLGRFDSIYVSQRGEEAALACAGRIAWDLRRGLEVLLLSLTGGEAAADGAAGRLGAKSRSLDLPDVPAPAVGPVEAADDVDVGGEWVRAVGELLRDLAVRARARHLYLPLGVDPARRPAYEAGIRVFSGGGGRNVFFYEERPYAFLPGVVRVRLAQLGARLPPGAPVAARSGLLRLLLRFHTAPYLGGVRHGWSERVHWTRSATREWSQSRGWRPQRAFGPAMQPVVHTVERELLPSVRAAVSAWAAGAAAFPRSGQRLLALAARYARQLGSTEHAERYWLLLPERHADGLAVVAPSAAHDPAVV